MNHTSYPATASTTLLLPPEWAKQEAVLLAWPHEKSDWAATLAHAETSFTALACAISARQKLLLVCADHAHQQHAHKQLMQAGATLEHIHFFNAPTNDTWARDFGPVTIAQNGQRCLLDFIFNGWGGKFAAAKDNALTQVLWRQRAYGDIDYRAIDFVLEGGSIEVDGQGTLLTTTSCLLTLTRNPTYTKEQIEIKLKKELGIQRILWLENSFLAGDDTDGHIDMLVRFCAPDILAHISCNDQNDEHYKIFAALEKELRALRTINNTPYKLVPLPIPPAKYGRHGQRLPASYANFLIINGSVIMPTYYDPADEIARAQLQRCFTDREIIGVPALAFIEQGGSVHCLTMQIPA